MEMSVDHPLEQVSTCHCTCAEAEHPTVSRETFSFQSVGTDCIKPVVSCVSHSDPLFVDVECAKQTELAINYDAKVTEHTTKEKTDMSGSEVHKEPAYPGSILQDTNNMVTLSLSKEVTVGPHHFVAEEACDKSVVPVDERCEALTSVCMYGQFVLFMMSGKEPTAPAECTEKQSVTSYDTVALVKPGGVIGNPNVYCVVHLQHDRAVPVNRPAGEMSGSRCLQHIMQTEYHDNPVVTPDNTKCTDITSTDSRCDTRIHTLTEHPKQQTKVGEAGLSVTLYKANLTDPENVEGNPGTVNVSPEYSLLKSFALCSQCDSIDLIASCNTGALAVYVVTVS